jgi:hypothetical protein
LKLVDHSEHPMNCEGMLGYEEEGDGDGIVGQYFDNE